MLIESLLLNQNQKKLFLSERLAKPLLEQLDTIFCDLFKLKWSEVTPVLGPLLIVLDILCFFIHFYNMFKAVINVESYRIMVLKNIKMDSKVFSVRYQGEMHS